MVNFGDPSYYYRSFSLFFARSLVIRPLIHDVWRAMMARRIGSMQADMTEPVHDKMCN
jgi:hypothetical protein